jgi:hypothetical protein
MIIQGDPRATTSVPFPSANPTTASSTSAEDGPTGSPGNLKLRQSPAGEKSRKIIPFRLTKPVFAVNSRLLDNDLIDLH